MFTPLIKKPKIDQVNRTKLEKQTTEKPEVEDIHAVKIQKINESNKK